MAPGPRPVAPSLLPAEIVVGERAPALERALRSTWGRALLAALLVTAFSLAVSVPRWEMAEQLRGDDVPRLTIFLNELLRWGIWGVAAWPLVGLARWLLQRVGWAGLIVGQLALSAVVSLGYLHLDHVLHEQLLGGRPGAELVERRPGERPFRGPGPPGRGPRGPRELGEGEPERALPGGPAGERREPRRGRFGPPDLASPVWRFRWVQAALIYWVVLGLGAGVQAFLSMREKERRASELELGAERLRGRLSRSQVDALRAQLQPHFLFNSLNSVSGLVRSGDDAAALRTLAAIGDLLRSTLEYGEEPELSLEEELQVVERYLEIERVRLGERLRVEQEVEPGVGACRVPALVLLPLVENAVQHGVAPLPEGGVVRLGARCSGEELVIEIADEGPGFPVRVLDGSSEGTREDRRSIGLENTRARLQAMYGASHRFELSNQSPRGARVCLVLPLRTASDDA